jgi:hypothetical protein
MSKRAIGIVAVLWVLSLLAVGKIVQAQVYQIQPVKPYVVSGPNFGIRIEGTENGVPVGLPVVQIDGKWVPVKFGSADGQTKLLR